MKRMTVLFLILLAMCGCTAVRPLPSPSPALPTTPFPQMTTAPIVSPALASPLANAAASPSPSADQQVREKAMLRDIKALIEHSQEQRGQEQNYKNLKKDNFITVERVTDTELKFTGKTQVFAGDYTGQFTTDQKYPYFEDASAGGKRYYNVKDNFGVWVIFQYQVAIKK